MELEDFKKEAAQEFAQSFETRTRDNGDSFACLKDDAPQWVQDSIQFIHGDDMFPDDWRYGVMRALGYSLDESDPDNWEDLPHGEEVDSVIDIYYGSLLAYATPMRAMRGDDKAEEFGDTEAGIFQRLQYAQFDEASEIAARLVEAVTEEAESRLAYWEEAQEAESDES